MSKTVLCVGIATQDHIFGLEALPSTASKFRARTFQAVGGGCGATSAVAVARLGGQARLVARLGDDAIGDAIIAELADFGVDCGLVQRNQGRVSPISAVLLDPAGERMIINYQDPAMPDDTGWLPESLPPDVAVVLADARWPAASTLMLARARAQGRVALLDGDMPGCPPEMVIAATLAAFSEDGLRATTGASGEVGLRRATEIGDGLMMVTLGAKGVLWLEQGVLCHQPAFEVGAVDTLGAGDVFHGALALCLAEDMALRSAVRFASAAAAIKVTRFGGRLGVPSRAEVLQFLSRQEPI